MVGDLLGGGGGDRVDEWVEQFAMAVCVGRDRHCGAAGDVDLAVGVSGGFAVEGVWGVGVVAGGAGSVARADGGGVGAVWAGFRGAFIMHMAAIYGVRGVLDGMVPLGGTGVRDVVVFWGAVAVSVTVVWGLAMSPGLQWLACDKWVGKSKRTSTRDVGYPREGRGGGIRMGMFRAVGRIFLGHVEGGGRFVLLDI